MKGCRVAAAQKHAKVAKGKQPKVMLPQHGEGSSRGQRWAVASAEAIGKEQGELFPELE